MLWGILGILWGMQGRSLTHIIIYFTSSEQIPKYAYAVCGYQSIIVSVISKFMIDRQKRLITYTYR